MSAENKCKIDKILELTRSLDFLDSNGERVASIDPLNGDLVMSVRGIANEDLVSFVTWLSRLVY